MIEYILACVIGLFGLFIIFSNYLRQIRNHKNRARDDVGWSSPAPVVGPVFVTISYYMLPFEHSGWILLVFALDPDTVITVVGLPWLIKNLRR